MSPTPFATIRARAASIALLAALSAAGCSDAATPVDTSRPERNPQPEPGVHAVLTAPADVGVTPELPRPGEDVVLRPGSDVVALRLYLVRDRVQSEISSYQIQLRYDPELMTFTGGTLPDGVMGSVHEPEPGRIRIAGVALNGVPDAGALDLEFRLIGERGNTELVMAVEELTGDLGGTRLTERSVPRRLSLVWGDRR